MFKADEKLVEILLNHGFIETTSERDKKKEKRSFKTSIKAKKEIHFDYIHIRIMNSYRQMDDSYEMNTRELKLLLLYFKLNSIDKKELTNYGLSNFKIMDERLSMIINEI